MKIDVNNLTKNLQENKSILVRTDSMENDMGVMHSYYKASNPDNKAIQDYLRNNETVNTMELAKVYFSQFTDGTPEIVVEKADDPNYTKISLKDESK